MKKPPSGHVRVPVAAVKDTSAEAGDNDWSMIEICREHSKNVKRWRDGTMALRWCAAGMLEAGHQFRRVNGHLHPPKLRAALEDHVAKL
jgi:hypothetical protein